MCCCLLTFFQSHHQARVQQHSIANCCYSALLGCSQLLQLNAFLEDGLILHCSLAVILSLFGPVLLLFAHAPTPVAAVASPVPRLSKLIIVKGKGKGVILHVLALLTLTPDCGKLLVWPWGTFFVACCTKVCCLLLWCV